MLRCCLSLEHSLTYAANTRPSSADMQPLDLLYPGRPFCCAVLHAPTHTVLVRAVLTLRVQLPLYRCAPRRAKAQYSWGGS